jgi:hypothetical protein
LHDAAQARKTAATVARHIRNELVFGLSGCRRLKHAIEALSGLNCAHDVVDFSAAGLDGTFRRPTPHLFIEGDRLFLQNLFGKPSVRHHQIDSRTCCRLDNLARQYGIAFLENANLALGIGGGDDSVYVGGFCGHDKLLNSLTGNYNYL